MFCDRCGSAVPASASQCPRCQTRLADVAIVPAMVVRGPGAWIGDGWNAVTANFWTFVLLGLIYSVAGSTVPIVVQGPIAFGLQWAALRQVSGNRADIADIKAGFDIFPHALMTALVYSIIVTVGMFLCIVPGIAAAVLLQFSYLVVLDQKLEFWPAIQESYRVAKDHFGKLLGLFCLQFCLIIAGVLLCGVGLFVALPVIYTSTAVAYIELFGLRAETKARLAGAPLG